MSTTSNHSAYAFIYMSGFMTGIFPVHTSWECFHRAKAPSDILLIYGIGYSMKTLRSRDL